MTNIINYLRFFIYEKLSTLKGIIEVKNSWPHKMISPIYLPTDKTFNEKR